MVTVLTLLLLAIILCGTMSYRAGVSRISRYSITQKLMRSVTSGTWTNATLIAALKNHIANEVTHYKGQCYAWDVCRSSFAWDQDPADNLKVVNEAFNEDGTYRSHIFYTTVSRCRGTRTKHV